MLLVSSKEEHNFLSFCFFSLFAAGGGSSPPPAFSLPPAQPACFFSAQQVFTGAGRCFAADLAARTSCIVAGCPL